MAKTFENIPTNSLTVIDSTKVSDQRLVSIFEKGTIELSAFAIIQLHLGAMEFIRQRILVKKIGMTDEVSLILITKLGDAVMYIDCTHGGMSLEVTRDELFCLKRFIEARMAHCELEREERNPKFNADTYIGQKLLLLDIRELLLGELL